MQFIESEENWRRIALAYPPFRSVVEMLEIFGSRAFDHAENVQVRMPHTEFGGDRRAVKHDGFEIGLSCGFQTTYEFG
jgi:hypothetical protein